MEKKIDYDMSTLIRNCLSIQSITDKKIVNHLKKKKDAPRGRLRDFYGGFDNKNVCCIIFKTFIREVLECVINGDAFVLPLRTRPSISAKRLPDSKLRWGRQHGSYQFIDLLKTDFKVYKLSYDFGPNISRRNYDIVIPKDLYKKFVDNQHKGVKFTSLIKYKYAKRDR